ncbi:MAG: sulfatase [Lentisphaerae bacterium]|nr:sulfatase [Lentisphaerota bacterium]
MNTLVILCDTLRRDHCNPYTGGPRPLNQCWDAAQPGWAVPTPNMSRLARRGTVFTNCWSGSTPCMPARRDMYTGRLEFLERGWGPLEEGDQDLPGQVSPGVFRNAIHTMVREGGRVSQLITDHMCLWSKGSGNYHMGYAGFDFIRGHQFDQYLTDPVTADITGCPPLDADREMDRHFRNAYKIRQERGEAGWFSPQVFQRAADWLRRNREHRDWFLHLDCFDPHEPWDPPPELVAPFMPDAYEVEGLSSHPPYRPWRECMSERQLQSHRARYAAMVTLVDRWLGHLLDTLDDLDLWKDTLVVFTTDHGTWNGERGRMGKLGTHQYDGVAHIPFIACHPAYAHGETRDQLVQLVDIYPTVLGAVNQPLPVRPAHRPLHGVNLLPVLADARASTRPYALTGMFGQSVTITDGRWVLHQAPAPGNAPLYWYGHQAWDFVASGKLGPIVDGRREVHEPQYWLGDSPTWLSDRATDPVESVNLAAREPAQLARMQDALRAELARLKAPAEQRVRLGLG